LNSLKNWERETILEFIWLASEGFYKDFKLEVALCCFIKAVLEAYSYVSFCDVATVTPRFSVHGGKEPRTVTHQIEVHVLHALYFHSSSHYRSGGEIEITDIYSYGHSDCRCSIQVWLLCGLKCSDPSSNERFRRTDYGVLGIPRCSDFLSGVGDRVS
jgi:hypothetical protein